MFAIYVNAVLEDGLAWVSFERRSVTTTAFQFPLIASRSGLEISIAKKSMDTSGETVKVGACANNDFDCGRNCRIDLVYCRLRVPYGTRFVCGSAYHAFRVARDALLWGHNVPKSVFADVAVLVRLFVWCRRWSIGG